MDKRIEYKDVLRVKDHFLTAEQRKRLIQEKVERAVIQAKATEKLARLHVA